MIDERQQKEEWNGNRPLICHSAIRLLGYTLRCCKFNVSMLNRRRRRLYRKTLMMIMMPISKMMKGKKGKRRNERNSMMGGWCIIISVILWSIIAPLSVFLFLLQVGIYFYIPLNLFPDVAVNQHTAKITKSKAKIICRYTDAFFLEKQGHQFVASSSCSIKERWALQ